MSNESIQRIAFIGFGEVGSIFGRDLVDAGKDVVAYDSLLRNDKTQGQVTERAKLAKVRTAGTLSELLAETQLVFSAATASSALSIAKEAAAFLRPSQIYVDLNSVSPETKKMIDAEIRRSGANFVEAAVMAAVKPTRLKTPILLGGERADWLAIELRSIGMDTTFAAEVIGVASAIKMCRSVVMKGLASLVIESLFTARRYGAEEAVLASFEATYPGMGWKNKLPDSLILRAVEHSRRRAAEMRESAETIRDAGITPRMSLATAELQDWLTQEMDEGHYRFQPDKPFSWQMVADAMDPSRRK